MNDIQLEIEGTGAVAATEDLLHSEGLSGEWQLAEDGAQRELSLATIATILGMAKTTLEIAKLVYDWYQRHRKPEGGTIEKAILVSRTGRRLLLENASVEDIKQLLDT